MAVDYLHRLAIAGSPSEVKEFCRAARRIVWRGPHGKLAKWRECVPLSFTAMYARCPQLTRIAREPPCDPYDISRWPKRALPDGRDEVRFRFDLRNLEMTSFLRVFSREFPKLELRLVVFCLDDDSFASYLIQDGKTRKYALPQSRHEWHWEQARQRFGIAGEDIYEDDDAREFAEEGMLEEALDHWKISARKSPKNARRHSDWRNRPAVRNIRFEQAVAMAEISKQMAADAAAQRRARKPRA